jgi:hypothetical protein
MGWAKVPLHHNQLGKDTRIDRQDGFLAALVTFMHYDLDYFDAETCRLEPIQNPFRANVLPM